MADSKAIANRIKSVRDTKKITNAMYLISSTKLRKARKNMDETSPFFKELRSVIGHIAKDTDPANSRYFINDDEDSHMEGTCGIFIVTADKGLAGAYNQNIIKESLKLMEEHPDHKLFVLGEYGKHYFRSRNIEIDESFDYPDYEPTLYQARVIAGHIMELYDAGQLSQIIVIYTELKNALSSHPVIYRMLPFEKEYFETGDLDDDTEEYDYFPQKVVLMEKCIPIYCIGIIYSVLVDSYCCEQNDRMMAMDSANQNADELIQALSVKFNHLRQSSITQEITEISASVRAANRSSK